ncbi:Uma2 family endonuclease [Jiangella alkaliphila]|uniref:Putative restriction endonuclease n=1 Tax=Jiangella alkaliphila TaxID=419479 RepID=A0A1H2KEI2_9ACTN|nr:Uma2 family endonuclease [Jiangella alkaliphila]SDU67127.1 Putative restriction endonuclease [Jiangella alkaliphila]
MNAAELPPLVPGPRGYRTSDLHGLPAGPHYELIDGCVIASPPPSAAETGLWRWLANAFEIANRGSPFVVDRGQPVRISEYDEVRPDVVVAHVSMAETTPIPVEALMLVVEVVSPSSALRDIMLKRVLYAQAGVPAYWTVIPRPDPPGLLITELRRDDATSMYVERTPATSRSFSTDHPWRVTIDVEALASHGAASTSWADGHWEVR